MDKQLGNVYADQVSHLMQSVVKSSRVHLNLPFRDLKPLRIPLHSKRSKRCPACTHILIKPEQKAQSVRYKIKLVAANYLPAIRVILPHAQPLTMAPADAKRTLGKSTSAPVDDDKAAGASNGLHAGKTYPFHLALTNPLYDPIQVRLSGQRMHVSAPLPTSDGSAPEKARRPPFAVSLPTSTFPVAAFAEAWEYEDDEDMFGVDDDDFGLSKKEKEGRSKPKTVGVLEKRANVTVIGGEVVIGKEARGNVKVRPMFLQLFVRLLIYIDSSTCSCRTRIVQTIRPRLKETRQAMLSPRRQSQLNPRKSRLSHFIPWSIWVLSCPRKSRSLSLISELVSNVVARSKLRLSFICN